MPPVTESSQRNRATPRAVSWHAAGAVAARQRDAIAADQLRRCGVTRSMTRHAVVSSRLRRVHPGVFRMSATDLDVEGRRWAALLWASMDALLSHVTAAILWALLDLRFDDCNIHLTTLHHRRSRPGIVTHEGRLHATDQRQRQGFPVTSLGRTALDCAVILGSGPMHALMLQLVTLHKGDVHAVRATVARSNGHPGTGTVLRLLDELTSDPGRGDFRSVLEQRFWAALAPHRQRLPPYVRNQLVLGSRGTPYLADVVFAAPRIIVELDGRLHDNDPAFDRDRQRDRELVAVGWRVLRVTWRHLDQDAEGVVGDLLAALGTKGSARS